MAENAHLDRVLGMPSIVLFGLAYPGAAHGVHHLRRGHRAATRRRRSSAGRRSGACRSSGSTPSRRCPRRPATRAGASRARSWTLWLWTSLSGTTFVVGLAWIAAGFVYLVGLTRMFTRRPPQLQLTA